MKVLISLLTVLTSVAAETSPLQNAYRCEYKIDRPGKESFVLVGSITGSDALDLADPVTYLTLQPPSSVGIGVDARILITGWNYNPIHLHPRGDTVTVLAHADMQDDRQELAYTDAAGVKYLVTCVRR